MSRLGGVVLKAQDKTTSPKKKFHARLRHDLAAFMARSIQDAESVLVVCTELYASRATGFDGGGEYENMPVAGKLMQCGYIRAYSPQFGNIPLNYCFL